MTIETKYNIGDIVYIIEDSKLIKAKVIGITIDSFLRESSDSTKIIKEIYYKLTYERGMKFSEYRLYLDEESAIKSISRKDYTKY